MCQNRGQQFDMVLCIRSQATGTHRSGFGGILMMLMSCQQRRAPRRSSVNLDSPRAPDLFSRRLFSAGPYADMTKPPATDEPPTVLKPNPSRPMANWRWFIAVFAIALAALAMFSADHLLDQSTDPHFVYLANTYNSMLAAPFSDDAAERREDKHPFELDREPPHRNDWASWWEIETTDGEQLRGNWQDQVGHGPFRLLGEDAVVNLERRDVQTSERRYFVSFPPAPAWLMMPLAAVEGYDVNDVWFTLLFAALSIMLMFLLLERLAAGGITDRSRHDNLWLTGLFGFGTVFLWCSILGQVWFTALVMGVVFTLLYLLCAIDARYPFAAGCFLALAFSTRTPLLFSAILFFAFVFFPGGRWLGTSPKRLKWAGKKLFWFCLPCIVVGLSLLWMNHIRFNDFTEFGHTFLAGGMRGDIQQWGLFHFNFLSENLTAAFALVPAIQHEYPYIQVSRHGMSLFLTTPAFLYLLWPRDRQTDPQKFVYRLFWATVAVIAIPAFFYHNTGFEQFGFRFSLDYTPYLIVLLALGHRQINWLFKTAILAGFAVNAFGAVTFKRMPEFYFSDFFV